MIEETENWDEEEDWNEEAEEEEDDDWQSVVVISQPCSFPFLFSTVNYVRVDISICCLAPAV